MNVWETFGLLQGYWCLRGRSIAYCTNLRGPLTFPPCLFPMTRSLYLHIELQCDSALTHSGQCTPHAGWKSALTSSRFVLELSDRPAICCDQITSLPTEERGPVWLLPMKSASIIVASSLNWLCFCFYHQKTVCCLLHSLLFTNYYWLYILDLCTLICTGNNIFF